MTTNTCSTGTNVATATTVCVSVIILDIHIPVVVRVPVLYYTGFGCVTYLARVANPAVGLCSNIGERKGRESQMSESNRSLREKVYDNLNDDDAGRK